LTPVNLPSSSLARRHILNPSHPIRPINPFPRRWPTSKALHTHIHSTAIWFLMSAHSTTTRASCTPPYRYTPPAPPASAPRRHRQCTRDPGSPAADLGPATARGRICMLHPGKAGFEIDRQRPVDPSRSSLLASVARAAILRRASRPCFRERRVHDLLQAVG
jgi:hypothetical protein